MAISELQLFAICNCNGFATSCPEDLITGQYSCECQGNTCGQSCERCCPLYNNFPYEVNTTGSALPCEGITKIEIVLFLVFVTNIFFLQHVNVITTLLNAIMIWFPTLAFVRTVRWVNG